MYKRASTISLVVAVCLSLTVATAASHGAKPGKCKKEEKRWGLAQSEDTIEAYRTFLAACRQGAHADEARRRLLLLFEQEEEDAFRAAAASNTYEAYAEFIASYNPSRSVTDPRYQYGRFVEEAVERLLSVRDEYWARKELERCSDASLATTFPAWLKRKEPGAPQRGDLIRTSGNLRVAGWYGFDNDVLIGAGRMRGIEGLPEETPITIETGTGHLLYVGGRGVITGLDGTKVLVGYDCEQD